jgi:hypothetical protein
MTTGEYARFWLVDWLAMCPLTLRQGGVMTTATPPSIVAAPPAIAEPTRTESRNRSAHQALLMLGALITLGALAIAPYIPSRVLPASAPADVFSAERALPHLRTIAQEPHPVGSPANARVRDYLLAQLSALNLQPQVQRAAVFRAPTGDGVFVENVLVRVPGTASSGAVLLTAHYDSVSNGPGAGDNGMAVAEMTETLRALRAGPPLRNDLIVLFNDGEEPGMYGSQAFLEQHAWATDVRVVFDFDADGPIGPSTLSWTTPRDGWLVGEIARARTGLVSAPLVNASKRQEFNNDLHVFAAAGYAGGHVDVVGGTTMYHTQRDSVSNADPASLQRQGDAMLALARHFGNASIGGAQADDATILMAFGAPVFSYPVQWTLPLGLVVGLAFVLVVGLGLWRRRLTARGLLGAAFALVGGAGALAVVAQFAWHAIVAGRPEAEFFSEHGFYGQSWFVGGMYALVLAIVLAASWWLVRRVGELHVVAAGVAGVVVMAELFAVAMPGLGYLAVWPALVGVFTLAYLAGAEATLAGGHGWLRFGILLLAAMPVAGIMVGPLYQPVLEGLEEGPALQIGVLIVLAALLTPQLALVGQVARRWLPGVLALISMALLGTGVATLGFSVAQPRPDTLAYGLDADRGQAYWLSVDAQLDEWTGQFLAGAPRHTLDELIGATEPIPMLAASAPAVALPPPSLAVEGQDQTEDLRTLQLRIASGRQAQRLHLLPGPGTRIVAANLGDAVPVAIDGNEVLISGVPADGVALSVRVRASGPAQFTVLDRSTGLPNMAGAPPRPATVMSAPVGEDLSGYPTLVWASFSVPRPED